MITLTGVATFTRVLLELAHSSIDCARLIACYPQPIQPVEWRDRPGVTIYRSRLTLSNSPLLLTLRYVTLMALLGAFVSSLVVAALVGDLLNLDLRLLVGMIVGPTIGAAIGVSIPAYFAFRNLLNPDYAGRSAVDVAGYTQLLLPYSLAFHRAVSVLAELGRARVLRYDEARGRIEAAVMPTWRSFGSRVTVEMGADRPDITQARITVRSPLTTTLVDFGANRRNLERIEGALAVHPR